MRSRSIWVLAALCAMTLAGCLSESTGSEADPSGPGDFTFEPPTFSNPIIFDDVRAGGEPVIAVLPSGTILISSHPGWTHVHTTDDPTTITDLLLPANAQSYVWRSTDGGDTWVHVDAAPVENVPRSAALGVSDPEWTVLEDGTICSTDLLALATSSVSCSMDDGQTWLPGNPIASGGPNDRQWLASIGNELYFTANYFVDHHIRVSTDYGLTWEDRGDVPCSQDLIGSPFTDHLIVGCTRGVAVSEDRGFTWEVREFPFEGDWGGQRAFAEPSIDAAGNTWILGWEDERRTYLIGTPDEGLTWPWKLDITPFFAQFIQTQQDAPSNGTFIWPWLSAGSDGRVAVSWIGQYSEEASSTSNGPWYFFTAFVYGANTDAPQVTVHQVTPEPIHVQPICQSGTTCQVASLTGEPSGDRRLGDFFETTIDGEGYLHMSWTNTAAEADDVVGHVQYARQVGGEPLLSPEDVGVFMPTQG